MESGSQVGAYRVLKQIGAGGMGAVWLAEHAMLGRRAAIKVLHNEYSQKQEIVARFFNEARAATAISDPGIVQIFDFGYHTDGSAYIVMELLDGEPLDKRLHQSGTLPVTTALRIMRQVASSLGAAHARGIVHRDLKPENIFLVRDPEVASGERAKILDFGIAKLAGDQVGVKTQTSAVMGTPTYMSPEQCRGAGHVDQRSDIYSLGCVLFHLLVGRAPFDAEGVGDIIAMHLREAPPIPSSWNSSIPPEVDQLILRCLAKDPAQRFTSGNDLAAAIGALLSQAEFSTAPGHASIPASRAHAITTLSSATASSPVQIAPKSRGALFGVLGVVLLSGGVITAIAIVRGKDTPTPPEPSAAPAPDPEPPPVAAPAPAPTPAPTPAPAAPVEESKPDHTRKLLGGALKTLATWAAANPNAPCPKADTINNLADAWGHPLSITCTDQPANQMIGVVSSGEDGVLGNGDDIASWTLAADALAVIRGPRWKPAAPVVAKPRPVPAREPKKPPVDPKRPNLDIDGDGIPDSR